MVQIQTLVIENHIHALLFWNRKNNAAPLQSQRNCHLSTLSPLPCEGLYRESGRVPASQIISADLKYTWDNRASFVRIIRFHLFTEIPL